jgi:hypothetical protein
MKILIISLTCLFSFNSFSKDKGWHDMDKKYDKMTIEDAKKMKLEMLDMHTSNVEKERTCITGAQDKSAFNECMKEMKKSEKEMSAEMYKKMETKM